ncbi:methylamine utilization protein [Marinobacter nanhaiticus]|uniref:methylamine utilization protein n=1 Tax=Marinobacter nanhaiticus TaxID=1305740 RepID=UPI00196A0622|nr:methylamine utilization protein [Marinobacter nanhaiticus]
MIDLCNLIRPLFHVALALAATPLWALDLSIRDAVSGEPLAQAVVSIPAAANAQALDHPAVMAQQDRSFTPHLLVVPVGTAVDFPNLDNTQHHVYSFSPAKTFNIELYADRPEAPVVFDMPGVVELGCNIHDRMRGFVYVTGSAQTATSGATGIARIEPPGKGPFEIRVWHERLVDNARPQTLIIDAGAESPYIISLAVVAPETDTDPFADLQRRFDAL